MHRRWRPQKLKEGRGDKNKTGRPVYAQRVGGGGRRMEFQASQGYKAINRLASYTVRPQSQRERTER